MSEPPRFRLTATLVKNWYQYGCERQALFGGFDPNMLTALHVESMKKVAAWAFEGESFEKAIVKALGADALRFPDAITDGGLQVLRSFLRGERKERYAVGADIGVAAGGKAIPLPPQVKAGSSKTDFIRLDVQDRRQVLTVGEIKAVRQATRFHKAQVAYYAELVDFLLRQEKSSLVLSTMGEVWHLPDRTDGGALHEVERFDLAPYRRMVREFVERDTPRIFAPALADNPNASAFHIYFKCEECSYLPHCRKAIDQDDAATADVSAVAGMSTEAKRELGRLDVRSVGDLAKMAGLHAMPGLSWSLKRNAKALVARARALSTGRIERTPEPYSMLMPPRVDVAIHLIADYDPVEDSLVTLGCQIRRRGEAAMEPIVAVLPTGGRKEADALALVFSAVLGELARIDGHNRDLQPDDPGALRAHLFVYEPAEANAIKEAVKRHLGDMRIRAGLLDMVRLFPPDDVIPEPEYRGAQHLPATALRTVVEHLFALPVRVSNDLARVTTALKSAGRIERAYEPSAPFNRPFSSMLAMDVIRDLRSVRSAHVDPQAVREDVRARLEAAHAVCDWLWCESESLAPPAGPLLRLIKKPFRFWQTFDPLDASDLDVLRALSLIENRAAILERLVQLARPAERRGDLKGAITGMTLQSVSVGQGWSVRLSFRLPPEAEDAEIGPSTFAVALTDGDFEILLNPARWAEVRCKIESIGNGRVEVSMHRSIFDGAFQRMFGRSRSAQGAWCLDEVINDINTPRVSAFLAFLSEPVPA